MKIAILPDVHIMERSPKNRIDKVGTTSLKKFEWCLNTSIKTGAEFMVIPGDLFDSALASKQWIGYVGALLLHYNLPVYAVPGQHDMRYHTKGIRNTPIGLLESHGLLSIPTIIQPHQFGGCPHMIYGCGWGDDEELRELVDCTDVSNCILIIHRMITASKPLFEAQEDWIGAKAFLRRFPFKAVFSGDNHERHITQVNGQTLVNGGSMLRSTRAQIDYQPRLHFYDTDNGKVTFKNIPIEPFDKVFKLDEIEDDIKGEERREKIEELINSINIERRRLSFSEVLNTVTKEAMASAEVKSLLDEIMEEAHA